jgi:voltage-gated potassium channel
MMVFEGTAGSDLEQPFDLQSSFWFSLYSLFAGEPIPGPPQTLGGKIVAVFVMFMGLTIFAMFTGTVSAFMVERLRTESGTVNWDALENHVIICGWNSKAEIIVAEFRASTAGCDRAIAVITQFEGEPPRLPPELRKAVQFLNDDFTRIAALEQAGVHRAKTCIIMADTSGGRSEQDADARTILAALTVEKLNPAVYTCAELLNRSYASHLKMGRVNDFVVSGEYGAYILAQAAMNRGLMGVFSELLTYQHGNEFYRCALPPEWFGKSFNDLFVQLKQTQNAILVAVHVASGEMVVNPANHTFSEGDEIVLIAEQEVTF